MSNLLKQVAEPQLNDTPYTYIYALVDPRNNAIRYIGKADSPKRRLATHVAPCNLRDNTHKNRWIKQLLVLGLKPTIETLDWVPASEWPTEERKWIARFRELPGPKLTNTTDGGEGAEGLVFSEETKKRLSEAGLGRIHSPESIEKMRAAQKGKKKTPQHCKNMSIAQKKKAGNFSDEEKKKIRNRPSRGRSKYRGVSKSTTGSWQANCKINGQYEYIGVFPTEEEAARERDMFVIKNFGADWPLNFPIETYANIDILNIKPRTIGVLSTNTSGYKGVSWRKSESVWLCFVSQNNKSISLGYFPGTDEGKIEAAKTYDRWVIQHRGSTAYTNFPRSDYQ